jgi:integrase/recombinase XerD
MLVTSHGQTIEIKKIRHREQDYLGIFFPYDAEMIQRVKSLPDRQYSSTLKCWYLPYSKAHFDAFLQICDSAHDLSFSLLEKIRSGTIADATAKDDHTGISSVEEESSARALITGKPEAADIQEEKDERVHIDFVNRQFYIRMRYHAGDIDFLKSLNGAWWNAKYGNWVIRGSEPNLRALQAHFHYWDEASFLKILELILRSTDPYVVELYTSPEFPEKMLVRIRGYGADVQWIKSVPQRDYDQAFRRWILPYDEAIIERMITHFTQLGAKVINRLPIKGNQGKIQAPSLAEKKGFLLSKYPVQHRPVLAEMTDTLIRMRYSWNTVTGYVGSFNRYVTYLTPEKVSEAKASDVNRYLSQLAAQKVSESLIHTAVNAIKFYYEKVVFRPGLRLEQIKRPKKSHTLPAILSLAEVDSMLRALDNLKHLAILYTLYSGGLRLRELLNLRCTDVYWDRNQIFIRAGKGKKDRVVMLSTTLKALLVHYFDAYQPRYWLFEGQNGNESYSDRSVQAIVKQAARKAGLTRKVTPHTLRHCFATHLLDSGTDVRYIQELLGHKDIKTTLVYTHVTTRSISAIESPLDQLKLGNRFDKKRNDDTENMQI